MIIRDNNLNEFKGTMLRGFNNTPDNMRNQIEKSKMVAEKFNENKNEVSDQEKPKMYNPSEQRNTIAKFNRINK